MISQVIIIKLFMLLNGCLLMAGNYLKLDNLSVTVPKFVKLYCIYFY